jgi:ketosteroid isomerase-like protein
MRECFRRLRAGQESLSTEPLLFVAEGEQVLVRLWARARVQATGKLFESEIIHLFTFRDGKVARLLDYFDTAAVAAAYRA